MAGGGDLACGKYLIGSAMGDEERRWRRLVLIFQIDYACGRVGSQWTGRGEMLLIVV